MLYHSLYCDLKVIAYCGLLLPFILHLLALRKGPVDLLHVPHAPYTTCFRDIWLASPATWNPLWPNIHMADSFISLRSFLTCNHHFTLATLAEISVLLLQNFYVLPLIFFLLSPITNIFYLVFVYCLCSLSSVTAKSFLFVHYYIPGI